MHALFDPCRITWPRLLTLVGSAERRRSQPSASPVGAMLRFHGTPPPSCLSPSTGTAVHDPGVLPDQVGAPRTTTKKPEQPSTRIRCAAGQPAIRSSLTLARRHEPPPPPETGRGQHGWVPRGGPKSQQSRTRPRGGGTSRRTQPKMSAQPRGQLPCCTHPATPGCP